MSLTWTFAGAPLWRRAYLHAVRSAFRGVPLYRERWALDGRTEPTLVPGRTGTHGGAIPAGEAMHRLSDLAPLSSRTGGNPVLPTDLTPQRLCTRHSCGHAHLDWSRVYARATSLGLAFTVLWQQSPRLVDIAPGVAGELAACPWHGTPVVLP